MENNKESIEMVQLFWNKPRIDIIKKNFSSLDWIKTEEDPIFQSMEKNISIGAINSFYINVNEIQDKDDEYKKIKKFLNKFVKYYAEKNNLIIENLKLQFINYGKTELVYVLEDTNENRVTLLVKQPEVKFGKVEQEARNLLVLQKVDKNVIAPIDYYSYGEYELYVTPYINQARCIASYGCWGMYIPEPYYRFEPFTEEQEKIVTCCMIAKLVSLYNFDEKEGIVACKLGGGDFMLPKGWEKEKPTIGNTLNNIYLIAAREKISCSFEEYLTIIRNEFSRITIDENEENIIMNLRGRAPIKFEDIENGIELGKIIIKNRTSVIQTIDDKQFVSTKIKK